VALAQPSPIRIHSVKTVTEGQRERERENEQWLEASWRSYLDRGVIRRGLSGGLCWPGWTAWRRKEGHRTCPALTGDGIREGREADGQTEIESRRAGSDGEGEQERVSDGNAERKIDG